MIMLVMLMIVGMVLSALEIKKINCLASYCNERAFFFDEDDFSDFHHHHNVGGSKRFVRAGDQIFGFSSIHQFGFLLL